MSNRLEAIWKVLTSKRVIVVAENYSFNTYPGSMVYQDRQHIAIEVKL